MPRIQSIQEYMSAADWDILMVQTRPNVFYLTGFDADPHERLLGALVFKNGGTAVVCPSMEVNQIKEVFTDGPVIGYTDSEDPWVKIGEYLQEASIPTRKIALESSISWARLEKWKETVPQAEFAQADALLLEQRLIKDTEELHIMQEAAAFADIGIETGIAHLKEGVTEMEVVAAVEYEMKRRGIREMSFSTMVLFGEKGGDPHGNPGSRTLQKGDSVLFDLGVIRHGYASDITRTVFFDHVTEKQRTVYNTVLEAQQAALALARPGTAVGKLDKAARDVIEEAGFGDFFPHRIGHGIGIEVHELPSMNKENTRILEEGMAFTIEPGIYLPGQFGVRIEDDLHVTADGSHILTAFPKELQVIPSGK